MSALSAITHNRFMHNCQLTASPETRRLTSETHFNQLNYSLLCWQKHSSGHSNTTYTNTITIISVNTLHTTAKCKSWQNKSLLMDIILESNPQPPSEFENFNLKLQAPSYIGRAAIQTSHNKEIVRVNFDLYF